MDATDDRPEFARNAVNLASPRLGTAAVHATDDFFADKSRMLERQAGGVRRRQIR